MSRTVIAGVVAAVIAVLTAVAYFVTTSSLDDRARKEAGDRVARAQSLVTQSAKLEALSLQKDAERLSVDAGFLRALNTDNQAERAQQASLAFQRFKAASSDDADPDIIALVSKTGDIVAMQDIPNPVASEWKDASGKVVWPAVALVLEQRNIISEIWDYPGKGLMRVGVAPVIDVDAQAVGEADAKVIRGVVVVAYAMTQAGAKKMALDLGTEVAYFNAGRVDATSFSSGSEQAQQTLATLLGKGLADPKTGIMSVSVRGEHYLAASARIPRAQSKQLPDGYPAAQSGVVILMGSSAAGGASVGWLVLLVGIGGLLVALAGVYLTHRRLMSQVDQVELGVADIINGNVDRTFRPVGAELDGLANGLNVMLARLLGRPEPGEEELDDDGNPIVPGRVEFDDQAEAGRGQADPELSRLAQESEPDYYKRVYTDYQAARKQVGQPDNVSFESFIAKLKVNEGKLKALHQCKTVRFRVVTADGKVSLKPVPIFE